jgi:hypothetical protein
MIAATPQLSRIRSIHAVVEVASFAIAPFGRVNP